jgi:hypothetical protein
MCLLLGAKAAFSLDLPEEAGNAKVAGKGGLEFRYGYMPSYNKMRLMVVLPPAGMTNWEVALSPQGGAQVLAKQAGELPFNAVGETMDIPDLAEGSYALTLTARGSR